MIRPLLMQARRRLTAQTMLRYVAMAWLIAGCALLPVAFLTPVGLGWMAVGAFLMATLAAFALAFWRRPRLEAVASRLDRAAHSHDRLTTALALEDRPAQSPMEAAALAECQRWMAGFDASRWLPWQMPRLLPWVALPLAALAALHFLGGTLSPHTENGPADPAAMAAAEKLEEMAKALQAKPDSEALKKVAEALKESAKNLRAEAESGSPEEAQKALLRELSSAEEAMKSARQQEAMNALAESMEAMKSQSHAAEAIAALQKGNAGEAAKQIEQLAQELASAQSGQNAGSREERMAQLQEAMQKAQEKLGEASRMGQAAAQAAKAAQQGDTPGASQAMRQMGQALRESRSGEGNQQAQQGSAANSEEIRKMLSALESMKQQGNSKPSGQGEGEGEGQGQAQMAPGNAPSSDEGKGQPGAGDTASGRPGSELDQGTKAQPFGPDAGAPPAPADLQTQIQGLFGEGESLHTLLPSRSGEAPARTGYRELYDAAAPAAEDAMGRENIPLGARLMIKRYFESIRPSQ